VIVTYDALPAVLDAAAALRADAPVLHPDAAAYDYLGPHGERVPHDHPNVLRLDANPPERRRARSNLRARASRLRTFI